MIKNKLSVYFVFISVFTVVTGFTLIVQKSYSNLIGPSQKISTEHLLKKINPVLDTDIIKEIESRPESLDSGEFNFINEPTITTDAVTPIPTVSITQDAPKNKIDTNDVVPSNNEE